MLIIIGKITNCVRSLRVSAGFKIRGWIKIRCDNDSKVEDKARENVLEEIKENEVK